MIKTPASTYFDCAQGESKLNAGIHPDDILVVDRSIEPVSGKIVICVLNGEFTVKRLNRENRRWKFQAENPAYADIAVNKELELVICGVVTSVIHPV